MIMDLLIKSGADQNSTDRLGKTASQLVKNKGKKLSQDNKKNTIAVVSNR